MTTIERVLGRYAETYRYPEMHDITDRVLVALEPRRRWHGRTAVAAAVAAAALVAVVPPARTAVLELLGLSGVTIVRIDALPQLGAAPRPIEIGPRTPRPLAISAASFAVLGLPHDDPAAFYFVNDQVALRYGGAARPKLVLTEWRVPGGSNVLLKGVPPATPVEQLEVRGAPGIWIGGSHVVGTGANARIAGSTLVWEQNGILYRLESALPRTAALRLANALVVLAR